MRHRAAAAIKIQYPLLRRKLIGVSSLLVKVDTRCCELFIGALLFEFEIITAAFNCKNQGLEGLIRV
jgi:hypothetical protein